MTGQMAGETVLLSSFCGFCDIRPEEGRTVNVLRRLLLPLFLAALVGAIWPLTAFAATDPNLGTAGNFAVLSGAGMTNTGPSWITGAIGASAAGITGFPPGTAGPRHIGDSAYTTAETDLVGTFTRA